MNCRELEERLERLVAGELPEAERRHCAEHLTDCSECRELEVLARLAEPPIDMVHEVLERTAVGACTAAHELLCDRTDGHLTGVDSELVEGHLQGCAECRELASALEALAIDLPQLANLSPGEAFLGAVMRRTLPWRVLMRRWWARAWPRWVQRPRFAMEAAYVATLVLVLIFATPGSPLEAMPLRAVELARTPPTSRLGEPVSQLRARVSAGLDAVRESEATGAVLGSWARTIELTSRAADRSMELADGVEEKIRTLWEQAASLLQRADENPSTADEQTDEETS
jgi:predicted anti-sigma-YlaC factor YlaD